MRRVRAALTTVRLDFETRSRADLKKVGAYRYAEDPSTEVLSLAYSIDGRPPAPWRPGLDLPDDLVQAVHFRATEFHAHNSMFERAIWAAIMVPQYDWPPVLAEQWRCSMAVCGYRALPLGLDGAGAALDLEIQKDPKGKALIDKLCSPNKKTGLFWDDPGLLKDLYAYNGRDVLSEECLEEAITQLPPNELAVFHLDQKINRRGMLLDLDLARAAIDVAAQVEKKYKGRLSALTNGAVTTHGQRDRILDWLASRGVSGVDTLDVDAVAAALRNKNLPEDAREVLTIRQVLSKSSVKKYQKMLDCVCSDGRVRGMFQYHGADTGRWAGRLIQFQNLPRPKDEKIDPEDRVTVIKSRDAEWVEVVLGDPMIALADALRNVIVAAPGKKLVVADYSAIEAVVTAGIAGEESKLDVFRRGEDPYCWFASKVLGYTITKKTHPKERQEIGKPGELAFGYQGGVQAWRNFDDSDAWSDEDIEGFRDAWRAAHPNIKALWGGLEEACVRAVLDAPAPFEYRGIEYCVKTGPKGHKWLTCRLPSGRLLWYFDPGIVHKAMPWNEKDVRAQVSYWATKEGQWKQVHTYGGKLTENVVQAASRDILVHGMFAAEKAGFPIIFHAHDEIVAEVPEDGPDHQLLEAAMGGLPAWAASWPIRAVGWQGLRYKKT